MSGLLTDLESTHILYVYVYTNTYIYFYIYIKQIDIHMCCRRIDTTLRRETVVQYQIYGKLEGTSWGIYSETHTPPLTSTETGHKKKYLSYLRSGVMEIEEKPPIIGILCSTHVE